MAIFSDIHSVDAPTFSTSSTFVALTGDEVAGAWAELTASLSQAVEYVSLQFDQNNTADMLFEFGTGAAASENPEVDVHVAREINGAGPSPHEVSFPWSLDAAERCVIRVTNVESTTTVGPKVAATFIGP